MDDLNDKFKVGDIITMDGPTVPRDAKGKPFIVTDVSPRAVGIKPFGWTPWRPKRKNSKGESI